MGIEKRPTYFVFIITSRDRPEYAIFDSMRRKQLLKIPHKFLINGRLPEGYTLLEDEWYFPDPSYTPGMFWKFYWGFKELLWNHEETYDYVLRINSSTFIDFTKFEDIVLSILPRQRCFAGHIFDFDCEDGTTYSIISGTVMIFSRDTIEYLGKNVGDFNHSIQENPDDIAISMILTDGHYRLFELGQFFAIHEENKEATECEITTFHRIKNPDRMTTDVTIWKRLNV